MRRHRLIYSLTALDCLITMLFASMTRDKGNSFKTEVFEGRRIVIHLLQYGRISCTHVLTPRSLYEASIVSNVYRNCVESVQCRKLKKILSGLPRRSVHRPQDCSFTCLTYLRVHAARKCRQRNRCCRCCGLCVRVRYAIRFICRIDLIKDVYVYPVSLH